MNPLSLGLPQGPPLAPVYGPGSQGTGLVESAAGAGLVDKMAAEILANRDMMEQLALERGSFITNLMNPSEEFGSWTGAGAALSNNTGRGPFNFFNGCSVTEDAASSEHLVEADGQTVVVTARTPKEVSLLYRPFPEAGRTKVYLGYAVSGFFIDQSFDVAERTVMDASNPPGGFEVLETMIQKEGADWYRLGFCILPNGSPGTPAHMYFGFLDDDGVDTYQGDGVSGGFIMGSQIVDKAPRINPYHPMPKTGTTNPGSPRQLNQTPFQDLQRYAYDLAAFSVAERQRRFG